MFEDVLDASQERKLSTEDIEKSIASNGRRLANYFIDTMILLILWIVILVSIDVVFTIFYSEVKSVSPFEAYSLLFLSKFLYYMIFEWLLKGKSIGKYLSKTKVVSERGIEPTFIHVFFRVLCRHIPFNVFSFLDSHPVGWHDKLSKTCVVEDF